MKASFLPEFTFVHLFSKSALCIVETELLSPIDDFRLKFEPMLVEHPTISDCGKNRVRWQNQLLASGQCRRDYVHRSAAPIGTRRKTTGGIRPALRVMPMARKRRYAVCGACRRLGHRQRQLSLSSKEYLGQSTYFQSPCFRWNSSN